VNRGAVCLSSLRPWTMPRLGNLKTGNPGTTGNPGLNPGGANTVTAYLLQQIQLLTHRDRYDLAPTPYTPA